MPWLFLFVPAQHVLYGRRPVHQRCAFPDRQLARPARVARPRRVPDGSLDGFEHRRVLAADELGPRRAHPGLGQRDVVAGRREDRPRLGRKGKQRAARILPGRGRVARSECRDPRVHQFRTEPADLVAGCGGAFGGVLGGLGCSCRVP